MNSKKLYLLVSIVCIIAPAMVHADSGSPIYSLDEPTTSGNINYTINPKQNIISEKMQSPTSAYHGVATYQSNVVEPFTDGGYGETNTGRGPRKIDSPDNPGTKGSPVGSVLWLLPFAAVGVVRRRNKNKNRT